MRSLVAVLLVALLAGGAAADDGPPWRFDAPCADAAELAARLRADGAAPLALELRATPTPAGRWRAIVAVGQGAARRVDGGSCAEVVDAALMIALLALDGGALAGAIAGDAVGLDPIEAPRRRVPVVALAADRRATAAPPALVPLVRLALLLEHGITPGTTPGEELSIGLERGRLSAQLGGLVLHGRTAISHGQVVEVDAWLVRALGCARAGLLTGCAGAEAGQVGVLASALGRTGSARLGALAAELVVGGALVGQVRGFVGASATANLVRPRVEFDDGEVVHQVDRLSLRVGLGLALAIP